jgi:transcriptional repressor NrdR
MIGTCTSCGSRREKVTDSRLASDGQARRRRYRCLDCDHRFTTIEVVVEAPNERVTKEQIENLLRSA